MNNKFCISKKIIYLGLILLLFISYLFFSSSITQNKKVLQSKAAFDKSGKLDKYLNLMRRATVSPTTNPGFALREVNVNSYKTALYYPTDASGNPDKTRAPFPVVMFHHGMASNYSYYDWLGKALADKGYLVVMPNRPSMGDDINLGATITNLVFTYLGNINTTASDNLYQLINLNNIAVGGHSTGAMIALLMAKSGNAAVKIKAVIPIAPDVYIETNGSNNASPFGSILSILTSQELKAEIDEVVPIIKNTNTPIMFITGSNDGLNPPAGVIDYYSETSSQKAVVEIEGANHVQFCQTGSTLEDRIMAQTDNKATITAEVQQTISLQYLSAWLDYFLKEDQSAKSILEAGKQAVPQPLTFYNISF